MTLPYPSIFKKTAVFALNNFGTGGHPQATIENLDPFGKGYIKECCRRLLKSDRANEYAKTNAARLLII